MPGLLLIVFIMVIMGWLVLLMLPKVVELNTDRSKSKTDTKEEESLTQQE